MPSNDVQSEELFNLALDIFIEALENGEIEQGLPKNSQGKGGYSISNEATKRAMQLISTHTANAVREAKHEAVEHYKKHQLSLSLLQRQVDRIKSLNETGEVNDK